MQFSNFIKDILNNWNVKFSHNFFIDQSNKKLECNCSSIFNYYFEKYHSKIYNKWIQDFKIPKAKDYFNFIMSEQNFRMIESVNNLKKYDFICWKKINPPKHGDTGHLMVLLDKELIDKDTLRVKVFDCSKRHHNHVFGSGSARVGYMYLILNNQVPIGYKWSDEVKKTKFTKILMGRFCSFNDLC